MAPAEVGARPQLLQQHPLQRGIQSVSNSHGEHRVLPCPRPGSSSLFTPGSSPHSYGSNISWTPIPECGKTSELSCDLTNYTLDPERRYYARVMAVSGDQKSSWKRTGSFSPQEGGLGSASTLCWSWGQGAKLLGKNCGMNESREISLHTFLEGRWAAQGDGTA